MGCILGQHLAKPRRNEEPFFVLAAVPSVTGTLLFLAVWAHQILLLDTSLLAEGGLGRYEQRVFDRRDVLAPASPWCSTRTRMWGSRPQTMPVPYALLALGGHVSVVSGRGLGPATLLVDAEPAARDAIPRCLAFSGFLGILASVHTLIRQTI